MKIINRYIGKTVLSAISLVTLVLIGLQIFISFVAELDDVGQGDYTLGSTFIYIFMQVPYQVYLFFPIATLLGCLIGLGSLASSSELIAMRTAGATIFEIVAASLKAAIIVIVAVTVLGETLMPHWVHSSANRRAIQIGGGQAIQTPYGIWLRSGDNFVHINTIHPGYHLESVEQYQFNDQHELILSRFINQVDFRDNHWFMSGVSESTITDEQVTTAKIDSAEWDIALSPSFLALANVEPHQMNLKELERYIRLQKTARQSATAYELSYWQRLMQPLVSCVMVFLAVPFVFGSLRQSSMGARIVLGAALGFGFHLINKFFGSAALVYQFSPIIGAVGPMIIFSGLAFFLMRRVK